MKNIFAKKNPIHSFNFDWDDNIMFMPTKIILFHKTTGEELPISTHEFAHVRTEVGVKGKYQDYQLFADDKADKFSYREFRDGKNNDQNNFLPQVVECLKEGNCFGPSFQAFQEALACEETAKHTTIITARGHNPESMLSALVYMQGLGLIQNLPPLENIYPVTSPKIKADAAHPSDKKLEILTNLLDQADLRAKECEGHPTFAGFSDDDLGTYKTVKNKLLEYAQNGRWSHVQVILYFTGKDPETKLLTSSGYVDFLPNLARETA